MQKILWIDTETTGLDPVKNDVIQIAYIIEIDGVEKERKNFKCQPHSYDNISQEAEGVHSITIDDMREFPQPLEVYYEIVSDFSKYIDKYNKHDRFYPGGYNVSFDLDFMQQFFKKCGDNYFSSWRNWYVMDPYRIITFIRGLGKGFVDLPNLKLVTVADYLGIKINAHDALSDIEATRIIAKRIENKYFNGGNDEK